MTAINLKKLSLLLFLMGSNCVFAQHRTTSLNVGDQIPDLELTSYAGTKINVKDLYQNGPLIIDFWATWCVPCIKEIRFMDSLNRKIPNRFKVLLVSSQDKITVSSFLSAPINQDLSNLHNNIIIEDTLLRKLFPHRIIPHNVWIDKKGIIKAITTGAEINEKSILDFNDNVNTLKFRTKRDNLSFRQSAPFHLGDSTYTYRSIISPYAEGIPSGEVNSQRGKMKHYFQSNQSILRALWSGFSRFNPGIRSEMIEIHTADSSRFFPPKLWNTEVQPGAKYKNRGDWERKNLFCYALTLPHIVPDSVFASYIYSDMERQFQIKTQIANRNINCTVVTTDSEIKLKPIITNAEHTPNINFSPERKLSIKNSTVDELLDYLFWSIPPELQPYPFINRTGYAKNFRFDLEVDFSKEPDIEKTGMSSEIFFKGLQKYGLNFNKQIESYPILIVYDMMK